MGLIFKDDFHDEFGAWTAAASARALFLRANCFYASSYHPFYGEPVDPRLRAAFRRQTATFEQAMALSDRPVRPLRIPFEGTSMPAWWVPAAGAGTSCGRC